MITLGLDLSTTATGAVVVEGLPRGGVTVRGAVTIRRRLPPGRAALWAMAESVRDLSKGHQLDAVAIEDVWVQRDPTKGPAVVLDLARLHGAVEYLLWRRGIARIDSWKPASWRKLALGKAVSKPLVPKLVLQRWAFDAADDHQADAFGVAVATLLRWRQEQGANAKDQLELMGDDG